jgi:signal transduction histidine kinase
MRVELGMIWMNFVWLGSGLSAGLTAGWLLWHSKPQAQPLDDRHTQLAYQMAIEMGQFKGGFLARTSHELRSPLNGIIGVHQLILADLCESPEEEHEFIAQAQESALKMVQMLDEVIHVARTQQGTPILKLQPVQLMNVLHDVDSMTHLLAKNRNLRMAIELPDPEIYVMADPQWFRQVLVSLVSGAVDQMQQGNIKLSLASVDAEFAHLVLEDERPIASWQEAIDLLKSAPDLTTSEFSPGFNLILNQTLLEAMNGRLDLLQIPSDAEETSTCIRCSMPIVKPNINPRATASEI